MTAQKQKKELISMLRAGISYFLDLIFPIQCLGCDAEGEWICQKCFGSIETSLSKHCPFCGSRTYFGNTCALCKKAHFLDGAISCVPYANPIVQRILHTWKYDGITQMTDFISSFATKSLLEAKKQSENMVKNFSVQGISKQHIEILSSIPPILTGEIIYMQPMPLHKKREKERGFNQSLLLARALSKTQKNWILEDFIFRNKKTHTQALLTGLDRSENIKNAFSTIKKENITGKHITIIDDVITTGSTCDECARVLKIYGAKSVWAFTVAYGHPKKS